MAAVNPRTVARWAALGQWPEAAITVLGVAALGPEPHPTVAELVPGQAVHIYGGEEPVTVLEVRPVASELDAPWVALRYQWATDAHGRPMEGVWVLPATQRLPLS